MFRSEWLVPMIDDFPEASDDFGESFCHLDQYFVSARSFQS